MYELAGMVTEPGSDRQKIHSDLPYNPIAPVYMIFAALQDITLEMGPTTFLPGSHTKEWIDEWSDFNKRDSLLKSIKPQYAALKCGDLVVLDARVFHCGNGNSATKGSTRALFNITFRNPKVTGDIGHAGSLRPSYKNKMNLGDVIKSSTDYANGVNDPFAKYLSA